MPGELVAANVLLLLETFRNEEPAAIPMSILPQCASHYAPTGAQNFRGKMIKTAGWGKITQFVYFFRNFNFKGKLLIWTVKC